jgi:ribosomal protein L37AE/L43A
MTELQSENVCPRCQKEIPESDLDKPILICQYCGLMFNNPLWEFVEEEEFAPIPDIQIQWVRFQEQVAFSKASAWLALGIRGSGKSSLLECISVRFRKIIDLYGSSDMEALCWCKPQFERVWRAIHGEPPRILLISGNDKEIASKFYTYHISELNNLSQFEEYDVITTCQQFFNSEDEYFAAVAKIINILWTQRHFWTVPWFVLVREASNWLYARAKVIRNDNSAKAEFIKAFRESRHHGLSMACDTLRWTAIDKEIRDIADYTLIKKTGATGLPDDLRWLYGLFKFFSIMQMHTNLAILSTSKGSVGMLKYDYPKWHKEEHENILKICKIEVKHIERALPDDRNYSLGAFEHTDIVKVYMETQSMDKAAKQTARSYATVRNHILAHNQAIKALGECKKCYNAHGEFAKIPVEVGRCGRHTRKQEAKLAEAREEKLSIETRVEEPVKVKKKFRVVNLD